MILILLTACGDVGGGASSATLTLDGADPIELRVQGCSDDSDLGGAPEGLAPAGETTFVALARGEAEGIRYEVQLARIDLGDGASTDVLVVLEGDPEVPDRELQAVSDPTLSSGHGWTLDVDLSSPPAVTAAALLEVLGTSPPTLVAASLIMTCGG